MWLSFFGVILLSALNLALIPSYGLVGAALAVVITSFILAIIILFFVQSEFSLSLLPQTFGLSLVSTLTISAIAFLMPKSVLLMIPQTAILFALHLFFLWSQNIIQPRDFLPKKKL